MRLTEQTRNIIAPCVFVGWPRPFRVRRTSEAGPCTLDGRSTGGCPDMGDGCGCSFLPLAGCPTAVTATAPDAHPALSSNIWRSTGSLKTHLPTCRLWYTQHLQIPVQKTRKNTPNNTRAQQRHRLLCSRCSECLDTCLDLGAAGDLHRELSVPLQGSVGSQCQGVPANHQVQLISSL